MPPSDTHLLLHRLDALRTELADLAFALERRRQPVATDVATAMAARLGELCEEFGSATAADRREGVPTAMSAADPLMR